MTAVFARLIQGSVTQLPLADGSIDVVLSFDVLYCLESPAEQAAITEMFRVTRPGGSVIINVAALDILKGDHSVLGGEVRRYTKRDLRAKLEQAGFTVQRLTYTNASLFPIMAAVRAYQRWRGVKAGDENKGDFYRPAGGQRAALGRARARIEARRSRHRHAGGQLVIMPGEKTWRLNRRSEDQKIKDF